MVSGQNARIKVDLVGRSEVNSNFKVIVNNQEFASNTISRVNTGKAEALHANTGRVNTIFEPSQENLPVSVVYLENSATSRGWLDFVEIQARRQLTLVGKSMLFRDTMTSNFANSTFVLENANSSTLVLDVTNPINPILQAGDLSGNAFRFGVTTDILREFVAFDSNENFDTPTAVGLINNQNLHSLDGYDMVVIYPTEFEAQATQFSEHRAAHSNISVKMILIDEIYNEFSSGRLDPTAIRDFAKMLYDRNPDFRYLLLFGDGSFDARQIYEFETRSNFLPVYETLETLYPIDAFPSDDYFALLSEDEGQSNLIGALDLAVGRFPVKNVSEAQTVVDKIIAYDNSTTLLGDWRNRLVFVADDEDSNLHIDDADGIANFLDTTYRELNLDKIYIDAFPQVSTPGGEKYPEATEAINKAMFKGVLAMNYLGHGGSKGWAQERILDLTDIEGWNNTNHYPLLVTATCSFSGYDDPAFTTGGERTLLNPKGGSIGLFTTVRAVFANSNEQLARSVFQQLFELDEDGNVPTIGEVLSKAKNSNSGDFFTENSRKFALLGDPSMRLAIPEFDVVTTAINGTPVSEIPDTLSALEKVTIAGRIEDGNGTLLSDFNGKIIPTIFDKAITVSTLVNDPDSKPKDFRLQKNIIFKGAASVENGEFEFSFVVPKDINYELGKGKISYYAQDNGLRDANGSYENIIIGGTNPNVANDDQPPLVEVFMNNEDFVFGGLTDENPILFVRLSDDNGINVAGSSIGHDLTGVLDENSQNTYLLNDFYEAELDDYTKGSVRFPLFDVPTGRHSIVVKAWDVANNSAEGITEFVVAESATAALEHVLNYPNPFTTNTSFQFEHNLSDQLVDVQIRIFTVSGKLVKTIDEQVLSDGYRVRDITWNGTDDYGSQLARGVYLYKVKIASAEEGFRANQIESDFEKLVILK